LPHSVTGPCLRSLTIQEIEVQLDRIYLANDIQLISIVASIFPFSPPVDDFEETILSDSGRQPRIRQVICM